MQKIAAAAWQAFQEKQLETAGKCVHCHWTACGPHVDCSVVSAVLTLCHEAGLMLGEVDGGGC